MLQLILQVEELGPEKDKNTQFFSHFPFGGSSEEEGSFEEMTVKTQEPDSQVMEVILALGLHHSEFQQSGG